MKSVTLRLIVLLLAAGSFAAAKPNIIFILADDLGYADLGCYGQKKIRTPCIDKLAAGGMKFTQMYSGSALCAPSRCAFITGLHPGHSFVRNNFPLNFEGNIPLPADSQTIPKVLRKAGYRSSCVGKWGLGYPGSRGDPLKQGFDHFYGFNCQRHAHTYFPTYVWNDDKKEEYGTDNGKTKKIYVHDKFTEENLKFIETHAGKNPFFCYMAYTIPHGPLTPPDNTPYQDTDWPEPCKAQAAMITRLDADVGKVVKLLEDKGIADNTLVIFTSDNGPHGMAGTVPFFNNAGDLKGKKGSLNEGGVRVPFIASWPGTIRAGSTSDHIGAFWDMLPTFAEIADAEISQPTDGISILPVLTGKGRQEQHESLYWELGGKQAVRFGKYKAVKTNDSIALYNLEDDIGEKNNLVSSSPELLDRANVLMANAHVASDIYPMSSLDETGKAVDIGNGHIVGGPKVKKEKKKRKKQ